MTAQHFLCWLIVLVSLFTQARAGADEGGCPATRAAVSTRPARSTIDSGLVSAPVRYIEPRRIDLNADPEYAAGRRKRTAGIVTASVLGGAGLAGLFVSWAVINSSYFSHPYPTDHDSERFRAGFVMFGISIGALVVGAAVGGTLIYSGTKQMERRRSVLLRALSATRFEVGASGGSLALHWTY